VPKKIVRFLVFLLQALSIYFIFITLIKNRDELSQVYTSASSLLPPLLASLLLLTIVVFLPIQAYRLLLQSFSGEAFAFADIAGMYARSTLAKYLPGNIFHIIGRQVLGRVLGIAQIPLAASSLFEIVLNVFGASSISLVIFLGGNSFQVPGLSEELTNSLLLLGGILPIAFIVASKKLNLPLLERFGLPKKLDFDTQELLWSAANYLIFLLSSALVFIYLIAASFSSFDFSLFAPLLAAFSLSFLIGYITPGAPGGIGVREALLVIFLSPLVPSAVVAATALLHRISWIGAELIFAYLIVPLLKRQAC